MNKRAQFTTLFISIFLLVSCQTSLQGNKQPVAETLTSSHSTQTVVASIVLSPSPTLASTPTLEVSAPLATQAPAAATQEAALREIYVAAIATGVAECKAIDEKTVMTKTTFSAGDVIRGPAALSAYSYDIMAGLAEAFDMYLPETYTVLSIFSGQSVKIPPSVVYGGRIRNPTGIVTVYRSDEHMRESQHCWMMHGTG